jgi:transposase
MIDAELFARIRRLFFAEHWKVGTIVAELGVHHDTVERAIESDRFVRTQRQLRPSLLDAFKPFIGETLDKHPKLRATRIFEMVRARGYVGGYAPVRRYVGSVRPIARAEAFLKLTTLPGEQAQVDWGHFGKIQVGAATRSLSCFVLVLSWSRAMYARFTLDQTLETFLRGHALAFETLGGVARRILYDNLKSVVLERVGEHIRFHPHILECAGHYHFAPVPCAPYRGNEKGKVERAIQYLRHGFFAARRFTSIDDLNCQLAEWIDRIAHARPVPGDPTRRPVRDALADERTRLLQLPASRFGCDHVRPVASGKQPYVRFDRNDYSRRRTMTPIAEQLTSLGLRHSAAHLDDLVAVSTKRRLGPLETIELLVEREGQHRAKQGLERRLARSRIGRFKPMADYEWTWPTRIDRDAITFVQGSVPW